MAHKKIQEQLLVDKLKHVRTDEDFDHHSEEIIKGISSKCPLALDRYVVFVLLRSREKIGFRAFSNKSS